MIQMDLTLAINAGTTLIMRSSTGEGGLCASAMSEPSRNLVLNAGADVLLDGIVVRRGWKNMKGAYICASVARQRVIRWERRSLCFCRSQRMVRAALDSPVPHP